LFIDVDKVTESSFNALGRFFAINSTDVFTSLMLFVKPIGVDFLLIRLILFSLIFCVNY